MLSFSPDVKKFPGAASCALRLLIARFFGWNRIHSDGTLSQSGTPEKLIGLKTLLGKSAIICLIPEYI